MHIDDRYRDPVDLFTEIVLTDRDVLYVCGYPRSGTTWMTRLLAQCLDSPALSWSVNNDVRKPRFRDPAVEGLHRRGPYVVRHGHWKAREPIMQGSRVIVVHRDPRDVAVSCWHYFNFRHSGQKGLAQCVGQICGEKGKGLAFVNVDGRGWAGYTATWLDSQDAEHHVLYEDMVRDPREPLARVLGGMDADIERIIEQHKFANRKADKTMRKGVAGGWKDELPAPLARKIETLCKPEMERLGYL